MKLKNIIITVAVLVLLLCCCITANAATYSGICGDNVNYTLNTGTGLLTISGTGDMWYDCYKDWEDWLSSIKRVIIEDGVTSIERYAFSGCTSLTKVSIPESVTSIGLGAFDYCTSLTKVTIPESVTSIGQHAFAHCTGLTQITIGKNVTSIGDTAFYGCTGLTQINWNAKNVSDFEYRNYVFYNAGENSDGITVVFGDNVERIPNYAFYSFGSSYPYPTNLKSVTIGKNVTSIGVAAFCSCTGLTEVTIGKNVTSIGEDAFNGCENIEKVYAESLESWCKIEFEDYFANPLCNGADLYIDGELLTELVIPESVTSIGSGAFCGYTGLTQITIGKNVTSIGDYAFEDCENIEKVYAESLESWCKIEFEDYCANPLYNGADLYIDGELLTELVIPESVTTIGWYAFSGCTGLTKITMLESVTTIGWYAFSGCTGLTQITIPESVTTIESGAFSGCTGLTQITIPESVTTIRRGTFYGCTGLTQITIPASVTSIEIYAFSGCTGLTQIAIPKSVTSIGEDAFYKCYDLANVYFEGTCNEWNDLQIDDGNDYLLDANIHYNKYGSPEAITFEKDGDAIMAGESVTIKPTISPESAIVSMLVWSSSDDSIATVEQGGVVTAVAKGEAVITVSTEDGSVSAQYKLNVLPKHTHQSVLNLKLMCNSVEHIYCTRCDAWYSSDGVRKDFFEAVPESFKIAKQAYPVYVAGYGSDRLIDIGMCNSKNYTFNTQNGEGVIYYKLLFFDGNLTPVKNYVVIKMAE